MIFGFQKIVDNENGIHGVNHSTEHFLPYIRNVFSPSVIFKPLRDINIEMPWMYYMTITEFFMVNGVYQWNIGISELENHINNLKERINITKCLFVMDFSIEGFSPYDEPEWHRLFYNTGIHPKQFMLVTSNVNYEKELKEKIRNGKDRYLVYANHFWWFYSRNIWEEHKPTIRINTHRIKKTFVCFNRIPRPHRKLFFYDLYERNLLKDGYVSFGYQISKRDFQYRWDTIPKDLSEINNMIPLQIDDIDFKVNQAHTTSEKIHEQSLVSMVTETANYYVDPDRKTQFITEKIFRPLMLGHPFLVLGYQNTLKELHDLGFKTFHPFINEEYDDQYCPIVRKNMILTELERLSKVDPHTFYNNIKPILDYNKNLYWKEKHTNHTKSFGLVYEQFITHLRDHIPIDPTYSYFGDSFKYIFNTKIPGYKKERSLEWSIDYINNMFDQPSVILIIGAAAGIESWTISKNTNRFNQLYANDIWEGYPFWGRGFNITPDLKNNEDLFKHWTIDCNNIKTVKGNGIEITIPEEPRVIFLDPDTGPKEVNEMDVYKMIKHWFPILSSPGLILGCDYDPKRQDVIDAVNLAARELGVEVIQGPNRQWAIVKD